MKIPTSFRLGASQWKVHMAPVVGDEDRRGVTYLERREIWLNPDMHETVIRETFIHELLHVCADFAGIDDEKLSEEQWVSRITPALHAVIAQVFST